MEFWKKLFLLFKRWISIPFLLIPLLILYKIDFSDTVGNNLEDYKQLVEFFSWIFAGVMTLIAFSTLFITFTYENKLVVASRNLKSFLQPYALSTEDVRNKLIEYENNLSKDKIISYIFWIFLIISFFSTLFWGLAVGLYTNFQVSSNMNLSLGSMLVLGIYSFYIILYGLLLLLVIVIRLIMLNKDPLDKGYLPSSVQLCDIKYLIERNGDIKEFFIKNPMSLIFFKNPVPNKKTTYEAVLKLPINISNLRYVIKFYNSTSKSIVTFYGKTKDSLLDNELGRGYSKIVTENFDESLYNTLRLEGVYAVYKIFDHEYNVKARYIVGKVDEGINHMEFSFVKMFDMESSKKDYDGNLIKMSEIEVDIIKFFIESKEVG